MSALPRWTLDELLARYELEPALADVFVEGSFDKEVLTACFRATRSHDRAAYEIDTVDVPASCLQSHDLTSGNKQRVIALAREFAHVSQELRVRFLVDRDLDAWLGPLEDAPRLVWTEFTSLELYFLDEEVFYEVVYSAARVRPDDWHAFRASIVEILRTMFLLRLADRQLGWDMSWVPLERFLSRQGSSLRFAAEDYRSRTLLKNSRAPERERFDDVLVSWESAVAGDPRSHIHGHDFVRILAWAVKEFRGVAAFRSEAAIQRLFLLVAHQVAAAVVALFR